MKRFLIFAILIILSSGFMVIMTSCKKEKDATPPVLTTADVTGITKTEAISGGNVTSDGGSSVTDRGVCWKTSQNPTIGDNKTNDGSGIGEFSSNITGLTENTSYYVRAYATNSMGTTYGNQENFETLGESTILFNPNLTYGAITDIIGNEYKTIQINTQVWMAENLKTTKYNDNLSIPLVVTNAAWGNLSTPGYCWYNNDSSKYKTTYGAMYNWYAANSGKLCPTGWHVPSDDEWSTLITFLGGEIGVADKLRETGITHWKSSSPEVTNTSGFTALPSSYRTNIGAYHPLGDAGSWWTTTTSANNTTRAHYRMILVNSSDLPKDNDDKTIGFSVRCVKD